MAVTRVLAKRGTAAQIAAVSSANQLSGEIAFATDTKEFYVSDGTQFNKIGKDQLSQFSEISVESNIDTWHLSNTNKLDLNPPEGNPTGITFKPDGTKAFVLGYSLNRVQMYDLSTAWDLTTAGSPTQSEYLVQNNLSSTQEDFFIDSSGTRMYVLSRSSDSVGQFTLNTAWDISDITFVQDVHMNSTSLSGGVAGFVTGEPDPAGITFKPDGTIMYIVGYNQDKVQQIPLSTAWDISTHGTITSVDVSIENTPNAVQFNNDGTVMYIMGYSTDAILQYNLSTAWDVTTASFVKRTTPFIRTLEGTGSGFYYNETEQKAFVCGRSSDFAYEVIVSEALRFSDPVSAEVLQGDKVIANELITGYTGSNNFFNTIYTHSHFQTYSTAHLGYNSGAQSVRVGNTAYGNYRFHVFQGNYMDASFVSNPTGSLPNIRFFNPYIGGVGVFSIGKTHNTNTTYLLGGVTDIESEADTFDHKGEITLGGELKVAGDKPLAYKDPNLYTQGTQIVLDNFTEASDTDLLNHTPDTGSGYTEVFVTSGANNSNDYAKISGGNGYVAPARNNSNDGFRFTNDTTISTANYEARAVIRKQSSSDDPFVLFVKYIDEDNYFAMHFAANYNYCTPISVVAGTYTQHGALYYYANTSTADDVNFEVALRVVGNNVHLFYEGRYRGSREVNITGIGKAGIGFGRSNNSILTSYDLTTNAQISKFEIYELPDSLFSGSDSVHYIENGGLGIGTTSIGTAKVVIDHTNTKMLELKRNGATKARFIADSNNGQLDLYDSSTVNSVRLLSSGVSYLNGGNVGIGTTSPDVELEVEGTIKASTHGDGLVLGSPTTPKHKLGVYGANDLLFKAPNNTVTMVITAGAKIGIGTTSPQQLLDIAATSTAPVLRLSRNQNIGGTSWAGESLGDIEFYTNDPSTPAVFGKISVIGGSDSGTPNAGYPDGHMVFYTKGQQGGALSEKLRITDTGNVGIGTASPIYKLDVNGEVKSDAYRIDLSATTQRAISSTGTDSIQVGDAGVNDIKFKNASGNSVVITSTGRVGVGVTNPSRALHVLTTGWNGILSESSTTNGAIIRIKNTQREFELSSRSDSFQIRDITDSDTNRFIINSSGKVGIGTTSPAGTLHVVGASGGAGEIYVSDVDNGTGSSDGLLISKSGTNAFIYNRDNGQISFGTNNVSSNLVITNTGNVGIGTTSPYATLTVAGNITQTENSHLISTRKIAARDAAGLSLYNDGGQGIDIKDNNDVIVTSGNVGIGTTSPARPLHVDGSSGARISYESANMDLFYYGIEFNRQSNYLRPTTNSGKSLYIGSGSQNYTWGTVYLDAAVVQFRNSSSEPLMRFDSSTGRLGIGTTSPDHLLHVAGNSKMSNIYLLGNIIHEGDVDTQIKFATDTIKFDTAGSERLTINSTGNVGIGTTNPSGTLHSYKATDNYVYIERGGGAALKLLAASNRAEFGTSNNHPFNITTNNQVGLTLDTSQRVGIGTTAPSFKLDVNAGTENIVASFSSTDQTAQLRIIEGSNVPFFFGVINSGAYISPTGATPADGISILNTGNVGIGIASPSVKLEIGTDGGGENKLRINSDVATKYLQFESLGNLSRIKATNAQNLLLESTGAGGYITFNANGAERMRVLYDGKVGIGTTSPAAKLDVEGLVIARNNGFQLRGTSPSTTAYSVIEQNGTEGVFRLYNGSNWGFIARGVGNNPYIGAYQNGSLRIRGFGQSDGGDNAADKDLAIFDFANERVGIGTPNPTEKLHVVGKGVFESIDIFKIDTTANPRLRVGRYNAETLNFDVDDMVARIYHKQDETDSSVHKLNLTVDSDSTGGSEINLGFRDNDGSNESTKLAILSTGNVGIGTTSPHATALLEVASTTKGVLFPRMTSAQRTAISSPTTGLIVYQTDATEGLYIYKSTGWTQII